MDGTRGYLGWRWIFILEGVLTCLVSLGFFFVIPSFPEDAKWLGEEERAYVKARLEKDQGRNAAERAIGVKDVINTFKDFKIFVGGFMYFGLIVPAYGYEDVRLWMTTLNQRSAMHSLRLESFAVTDILQSAPSCTAFLRGHVPSCLP